jgi:hypothetical protein
MIVDETTRQGGNVRNPAESSTSFRSLTHFGLQVFKLQPLVPWITEPGEMGSPSTLMTVAIFTVGQNPINAPQRGEESEVGAVVE